jgi:phosphohistidine phosphatase
MELYLIRHGIAEARRPDLEDEKRELTAKGRDKTQKVAQRLYEMGLRFELILTSPLARARQTAEILQTCNLSSQIEESSHLSPEGDFYLWSNWLEQKQMLATDTQLALVGHEPDLGQWAEILIWGKLKQESEFAEDSVDSYPAALVLKKAGIIGVNLPKDGSPVGRSQLFWLASPKFLI